MEITKEQEERILALDPNFFKSKLEVGKWYKSKEHKDLIFIDNIDKYNRVKYYGFDDGSFKDERNTAMFYGYAYAVEDWTLATNQEVEDALIIEAKKRGFNNISCFKPIDSNSNYNSYKDITFGFKYGENELIFCNRLIFKNGNWAEILETITKAEAEKLLNKIII